MASGENVGKKHLTSLEIKPLVRMLNRLVIDFLIVLVNELVNRVLSGVVARILPYYLAECVEEYVKGNVVILSGK